MLMGLTHHSKNGIRKSDITVAKNYLNEEEIDNLNRIVSMWLDFAEDQAKRKKQFFLQDWISKLDQFLEFNDREVLSNAGKITKKQADEKALLEYSQYLSSQRRIKEIRGETDIMELLSYQNKIGE